MSETSQAYRNGLTVLKLWRDDASCLECCWGDRCDEPRHFYRPECPHCAGTGRKPCPDIRKDKAFAWDVLVAYLERGTYIARHCAFEGDHIRGFRVGDAGYPIHHERLEYALYAAVEQLGAEK